MSKRFNRNNMNLLLSISLIISLIPSNFVDAAYLQATIYSYPADPIPTIDGVLSAGEWTAAGMPEKIKLLNLRDQYLPHIELQMRSVYSMENEYLFLAVEIPDTEITAGDEFTIAFNTSDTPLALNPPTHGVSFDDDHDAKLYFAHNNDFMDGFTAGIGFDLNDDTAYGGSKDGEAKGTGNGTYLIIEFGLPLNSGDAPGHDLNLTVGNYEDIFMVYRDSENETIYSHWLQEINDYDYNRIHIGAPGAIDIEMWTIIASFVSILAIAVIIKRKK